MCRIGFFNFEKMSKREKAVFTANVLRNMDVNGGHSQGVLMLKKVKDGFKAIKIIKMVGSGKDNYFDWIETLKKFDFDATLVHNRFATHGSINVENAHPIQYKNIVLVHNGVFYDYKRFLTKREKKMDITDTYAIAKLIAHENFKALGGAGALLWFNSNTKKVYGLKANGNPLEFFQIKYDGEKEVFGAISDAKLIDYNLKEEFTEIAYIRGNVLKKKISYSNNLLSEKERITETADFGVLYEFTAGEIRKVKSVELQEYDLIEKDYEKEYLRYYH